MYLQEINHNNPINKHQKSYPSLSLEHSKQSTTHISHVISPEFVINDAQPVSHTYLVPTVSDTSLLISTTLFNLIILFQQMIQLFLTHNQSRIKYFGQRSKYPYLSNLLHLIYKYMIYLLVYFLLLNQL